MLVLVRVGWVLFLLGCSGAGTKSSRPVPAGSATATALNDAQAPIAFDRDAAKRALDAVKLDSCQALPPLVDDGGMQMHVTFDRSGSVRAAVAATPFAGTPFGECAERLFMSIRVARFDGEPVSIDLNVPRGPVRGGNQTRFEPWNVRDVVQRVDLTECGQASASSGQVTIVVKPTGQIESLAVEPPLAGTAQGNCIERRLRRLELKPYRGSVVAPPVTVDVDIPAKR